jgi:hypothetical protein
MDQVRTILAHVVVALASVMAGCWSSHDQRALEGSRVRDASAMFSDGGCGRAAPEAATPRDAAAAIDAGARDLCAAQRAEHMLCAGVCDGPPTWHWNGDDCRAIECGACTGEDCGRGWSSESACLEAHATCAAALCRATAGTWMWWAEECGHYACGQPPPAICEVGFPVCDCGTTRRFDPVLGCVAADCPEIDPLEPELLCRGSGGSWENICCHTECGDLCGDDCAAPACNCGAGKTFDLERGCIDTQRCHERSIGESCAGEARCQEGALCCERCGGAGCFGTATCTAPVCDEDEHTDLCGNRDDVP